MSLESFQQIASRILQSSPELLQAHQESTNGPTNAHTIQEQEGTVKNLQDQLAYRTSSYIKMETELKKKIKVLEQHLENKIDENYHQRMKEVRSLHENIILAITKIQGNTSKILQSQENDLMRTFRARLQDLTKELEKQKEKKNDIGNLLRTQHQKTLTELSTSRELALIFDEKITVLQKENKNLMERIASQNDELSALMSELVSSKKENMKLSAKINTLETAPLLSSPISPLPQEKKDPKREISKRTPIAQETNNLYYEKELCYRERLNQMKRQLDSEKAKNLELKKQLTEERNQHNDLEKFLKECLDDVKKDLQKKKMSDIDREKVLALLLSKEKVVQLLYDKTFGIQKGSTVLENNI